MPGFRIGSGGNGPANNVDTVRKNDFLFTVEGVDDNLRLYCHKAGRPKFEITQVEMHFQWDIAKFAGKHTFQDLSLTYYDAEQAHEKMVEWSRQVRDFSSGIGVPQPVSYKKSATLSEMGSSSKVWKFLGAWPKNIEFGDKDWSNADIQEITVTIAYDRALTDADGGDNFGITPQALGAT